MGRAHESEQQRSSERQTRDEDNLDDLANLRPVHGTAEQVLSIVLLIASIQYYYCRPVHAHMIMTFIFILLEHCHDIVQELNRLRPWSPFALLQPHTRESCRYSCPGDNHHRTSYQ